MIVKYCDRCKEKIEDPKPYGKSNIYEPFVNSFPKYKIIEYSVVFSPREKHLCNKCSKDLSKWIREYEGGD